MPLVQFVVAWVPEAAAAFHGQVGQTGLSKPDSIVVVVVAAVKTH
jgi:hypothetical protein